MSGCLSNVKKKLYSVIRTFDVTDTLSLTGFTYWYYLKLIKSYQYFTRPHILQKN